MNLSTKTRYSLRVLLQIALDTRTATAVKGRELAAKQNISEAYLEQIMISLKSAGLINTVRGRNGGYSLAVSPEQITVLQLIELFEGKIEFANCGDGGDLNAPCALRSRCMTAQVWDNLSKVLAEEAGRISLADILEKHLSEPKQEYVI